MAEDKDKKESGEARSQGSESTPTPKTEIVAPTFEIAVKSEKGHKIVPATNVNNESE